ncbi:MAG TPA: hypothetical protein VLC74_03475 [Rhizomicrobium sp.]|nr:hypothetical protein [Rhizomicrobium sp.]
MPITEAENVPAKFREESLPMGPSEIVYLAMVIAAFSLFGIVLAVVGWYENTGARNVTAQKPAAVTATEAAGGTAQLA